MSVFDVFNPLAHITPRFTEEQLTEIIEWFDENSKPLLFINDEPHNVITIDKLIFFLGLKKWSYNEIMREAEDLKAGVTKMLTKEQFLYLLNKWVIEIDIKHELKLAFKIFDTEKRNFLEIDEIQGIVTGYGSVFNEAETIEMLRDANVRGDGNVYYEDFVETLFSFAPELYELKTEYLYTDPDEDPSVPPEPVIEEEKPPPPPPPSEPPPKEKSEKKKK